MIKKVLLFVALVSFVPSAFAEQCKGSKNSCSGECSKNSDGSYSWSGMSKSILAGVDCGTISKKESTKLAPRPVGAIPIVKPVQNPGLPANGGLIYRTPSSVSKPQLAPSLVPSRGVQ